MDRSRHIALFLAGTVASALLASLLIFHITAPASALGAAAAIKAGGDHSCALTSGGGVSCWGENGSGQLGNGTAFDSAVPGLVCELSAGATAGGSPSCCPIIAGSVLAGFVLTCTPLSGVDAIATGGAHNCALMNDRTVDCWGANGFGQLGNGGTSDASFPVHVCESALILAGAGPAGIPPPSCCPLITSFGSLGNRIPSCSVLANVTAIAAGDAHTCALLQDATVRCWGANSSGQLGDGTTFDTSLPALVCTPLILSAGATAGFPCAALTGVVAIAAGGAHTCALLNTGTVRCWGENSSGQLGNGTFADSSVPLDVCTAGPIIAGTSPQITPSSCCPILLSAGAPAGISCSALSGVAAITAGGAHTCARLDDATVRCWGANSSGQLGNGTMINSSVPTEVCQASLLLAGISPAITPSACCPVVLSAGLAGLACNPLLNVAAIAAGGSHTCALIGDSTVRCWGENGSGQLGDGFTFDTSSAVDVCQAPIISGDSPAGFLCNPLSGVAAVATGGAHTCALTEAGGALCWGANSSGKLGNGGFINNSFPTGVIGIEPKPTTTPPATPTSAPTTRTPTAPAATATSTAHATATRTPVPVPGTATRTPMPPPGGLSGDVDCSGGVNPIDAALILQLTAALIHSLACSPNGDVNGDGIVNVLDAALILQYAAGLVPNLPV